MSQPPRVAGSCAVCRAQGPEQHEHWAPTPAPSGVPRASYLGCFVFTFPSLPAPMGLLCSLLGCWVTLLDHRPDISVSVFPCQAGTRPSNRFSLHNRSAPSITFHQPRRHGGRFLWASRWVAHALSCGTSSSLFKSEKDTPTPGPLLHPSTPHGAGTAASLLVAPTFPCAI